MVDVEDKYSMEPEVKEIADIGVLGTKKFQFVRQGRVAHIRLTGGGRLPEELEGGWTDIKNATEAVNNYLAKKALDK